MNHDICSYMCLWQELFATLLKFYHVAERERERERITKNDPPITEESIPNI